MVWYKRTHLYSKKLWISWSPIFHCEISDYIPLWVSESSQLCLTLCYLMDYRVHGILQTKILERIAVPFSKGSSQSRDRTQVSYIAGRFFTSWTTKEALIYHYFSPNIKYLCVCTKPRLCSFYPFSYLLFSLLGVSSACGKGHEEGGLAYAKVGSSLRSSPGNSRASTPPNQSLPTFCCVLSRTPLTLRGAVPDYLSLKKELAYSSS